MSDQDRGTNDESGKPNQKPGPKPDEKPGPKSGSHQDNR